MVYLKNLSSSECFDGILPWEFTAFDLVPPEALGDKTFRDRWINNPDTDYHVYTLYEGVQKNLRLKGAHNGEDDNPPLVMHGLAVDYDAPTSLEQVQRACETMGAKQPQWFEQTLSGNGRLLWLFDKPLLVPNRRFLVQFLKTIGDFLPVNKLPGLDESALLAPERYFTNGARWTKLSSNRIHEPEVVGYLMKVSAKFDWTSREFGKAANLPDIEEECRKRYPKFADWPGEFVVGAQGPSFWIDNSTSPKSCFVRETGLHTFSAHASKAFYPWAEIVGKEFVETSESRRLGKAVEGINYDGRNFIMKDGTGRFAFHNKDNLSLLLRTHRGLNGAKKRDGSPTEVDQALAHILQHCTIEGAGPCAFYPHGVFQFGSKRILNTHQIETMRPSGEASVWGATGKFPFLSEFFDTFFFPVEPQRDRFLAWFRYHYSACLIRTPVSGHGVFIAGPVGCGKTFLNRGILGTALGGFAEANAYLISSDNFNSELFDYALWCIDDGSVTSSDKVHQLFSENVKRTVANRDHRVNEKFRKAFTTPWQGRIVVTLNQDPESLRLIPNVDSSILEKLFLLLAGERKVKFLSQPAMEEILVKELPYFLRWLVDWTPPPHCYEGAEVRFGLAPYHEPSLLRAANLSSGKSVFNEILTRWLREHFEGTRAEFWEGTATELRMAMIADPVYSELLRTYRPETIPRMLITAMNKKILRIEMTDSDTERSFKIYRDTPVKVNALVVQADNSTFEKKA